MYEAKYSKYITKNTARFAEPSEIKSFCKPIEKNSGSESCGAPMYYENGVLYIDDSDVHHMTCGNTGCKKSRLQAFTTVNSTLNSGENAVINDPKGEIFKETSELAKAKGYNTYVLNLRDVTKSNGWNPLSLAYDLFIENKIADAHQNINDITESIIGPARNTTTDIYWANSGGTVFTASAFCLMDSVPRKYFNLSNVIQLTNESTTDTFRRMLSNMDQKSSAANLMHGYLDLGAEKTLSCIYSALKACLTPFVQNEPLLDLLCRDEIDFKKLAYEKTVIYIIYPDEKESLCFLINLFLTQCYQALVSEASKQENGRLPKRVNFIIDEFSNLPEVNNFSNRISEARGRNIRYFLFIQSFSQLKNKYKENADTIKANCDWIIFPSKEIKFLEEISSMCGKVQDYRGREKPLMSAEDIMHLKKFQDCAEVLIIKNGQYPFVSKIPDYEYIDIFGKYPKGRLDEITACDSPVFFSFDEWIENIGKKFNFPFPKTPRTVDLRVETKPNKEHKVINENDIQAELERKFDELFGSLEDD